MILRAMRFCGASKQQQAIGLHESELFLIPDNDGDIPAFAGPHPRLGHRYQLTRPVHPDGFVFPFRHDPVRHESSPYAIDN